MIQLVQLKIGFQTFIEFTLSYKVFIPSLLKLFAQSIQPLRVQAKWVKNKLQQQQLLRWYPRKASYGKRDEKEESVEF